jgi:23S rRNA (adenine2503-C2)-methyltransferase
LPETLRNRLAGELPLGLPRISERFLSTDGTRRYLLALADGRTIEAVFMPEARRDTICISSQVGCAVECRFCLTAQMGLERNLTAGEIVGQVLAVLIDLQLETKARRLNLVMMGMGEPLLNLPNVQKAIRLLSDSRGMNISPRRITLSTSGITPKLDELAAWAQRPRLAISLNASSEEQRGELMPITRKYHLAGLLDACVRYAQTTGDPIFFEYVLLAGVNDSDDDAHRVAALLAPLAAVAQSKLNVIAVNPAPGIPYQPPAYERVIAFQNIVRQSMPCFLRKPRGRDVYAACGQLKRMDLVTLGA